ncbi:DUF721 domain-containing protein [Planctomyces sp. SH-PL14]|uniref:DUF721 domain-containing protein n=1 Tax=Planctomyces sp. SH-PL14 TaxID=1632864 RepID=UPI0018D3F746|nr:DUF721 domain-containing protein [Planctomyces sp. SH-PL14]
MSYGSPSGQDVGVADSTSPASNDHVPPRNRHAPPTTPAAERPAPPPSPPPQDIGAILTRLFALRGYGRIQGDRQLQEAWQTVAGPELSRGTRATAIKNGVLHVGVSNAALLSELVGFHRTELLAKLKTDFPHLKVRDIKFKKR